MSRETDVATTGHDTDTLHGVGDVAEHIAEGVKDTAQALVKPRARGWIHLVSAVIALFAGVSLIAVSWPMEGLKAGLATFIYTVAVVGMFTTSAVYHRVTWKSPQARMWMKRLDHSMIFVLIASSYTPIILLALEDSWRIAALAVVWGLSLTGVALRLSVRALPRWVMVVLCVGLGWGAVSLMPALGALSSTALALVITSGVLYTLGGLVYLTRRPDPLPRVFGFHEVFHAFVVLAASLHFVAVWPLVTV